MIEETIDKKLVEKRVEDWVERISSLYTMVESWLLEGKDFSIKKSSKVRMYEELMQKFDVEPVELTVMDICLDGKIVATLKPAGLWIIGVNGRIDLLTRNGSYIIIDKADRFEPPKWKIHNKNDKGEPRDLEEHTIKKILGEL